MIRNTVRMAIALVVLAGVAAEAQIFRHKALFHATDCPSLTGKKANQFCYEQDDDAWYVCEPTSGDCDTAGEWIKVASATTGGGWTDSGITVSLTTISDRVGIGTNSPDSDLHVVGGLCIEATDSGCTASIGSMRLLNTATNEIVFIGEASATNIQSDATIVFRIDQDGDGSEVYRWRNGAAADLMVLDEAGTLQLLIGIDALGAASLDYGSGDVTDHTFLTDGTGTSEIVLPAGAIDSTEILDDTIAPADVDETLDYSFETLSGKQLRFNTAVDDDDCTGDQSKWWYDTTDGRFEFCNAGAGAPAILAGGGGAGAFADAADPVVLQSVGKDVVIGPAQVNTSKLTIDGDADQVQVTIQGNSPQNVDLFVIEDSGGTDLLNVKSDGDVGVGIITPDGKFHIQSATAGSVVASTAADELVIEAGSGGGGISILTPNAEASRLAFGGPAKNNAALAVYTDSTKLFSIGSNVTGGQLALLTSTFGEAIRIDDSKRVGLSTNSPNSRLHVIGGVCVETSDSGCVAASGSVVADILTLIPTDAPPTCAAATEGGIYYDDSLNEHCACNGATPSWNQLDGGGAC